MLAICTLLWDSNRHSLPFSTMYDETWVEKLYHGFSRHLTAPFEFICYSDRPRVYSVPVTQMALSTGEPDYGNCIEPYALDRPMILVGLDTVVTGNCDALAEYCMTADRVAVPRDPYNPEIVCNGVALVPAGMAHIARDWSGQNDMAWIRQQDPAVIDDLFSGQVASYKGSIKAHGLGDARIVYFHGEEKPHQLRDDWIRREWTTPQEAEDMQFRRNHAEMLPGEVIKGASGWKGRQTEARKKMTNMATPEREAIRAARAANRMEENQTGFNPSAVIAKPAKEEEPAIADAVGAMSDEDLAAFYEQATGKKPHHLMKRTTIEAAVREALA